jgi:hypothetical protein
MRANHVPRALLVSVCVAAWITACGAEDAVDRAVDCDSICGRYADCFGSDSYDTAKCEQSCRDKAADDACIDDESCASGAFECADECLGIVP